MLSTYSRTFGKGRLVFYHQGGVAFCDKSYKIGRFILGICYSNGNHETCKQNGVT